MAGDREKAFGEAERLLKQGKEQSALDAFRRIAEESPRDTLMINRIGDALARSGKPSDAIVYYERAADQFGASGFYPKAAAILKKVVKLDPQRIDTLIRLGDLNLRQKLGGEARTWLLMAAEACVKVQDFRRAREVYERIVAADPSDVAFRGRLAEARAAEGDRARGAAEFVSLADYLVSVGRAEEAEAHYRRAAQLDPSSSAPAIGLARALSRRGRHGEAAKVLEAEAARKTDDLHVLGAYFEILDASGDAPRVAELLQGPLGDRLPDKALEVALSEAVAKGRGDATWSRFLPLFDRWAGARRFDRLAQVLEKLSRVEPDGFVPALERLRIVRRLQGHRPAEVQTVERLVRVHQSRRRDDLVAPLLEDLRALDPDSPFVRTSVPRAAPEAARRPDRPAAPRLTTEGGIPLVADAPAVPLSPADEEFVSGHMTEAEVFEKYGLLAEALQQLREVARRFPGYLPAVERLAVLLRARGDRHELRDVAVALALARRAAGRTSDARHAAGEAESLGPLDDAVRTLLQDLSLLDPRAVPREAAAPPRAAAVPAPAPAVPPAATAAPATPASAAPPPPVHADDMEIVFDEEGASGAEDSPELVGLADEDDLSVVTDALQDLEPSAPAEPEAEGAAERIEEALDAFKRKVDEEVGADDHRTHYDLGIAYKEMGLVDEALAEFQAAAASPAFLRAALAMIALIHRERGEVEEAARSYRQALLAPVPSTEPLTGLRYELAETLVESGDFEEALHLFREILEADPVFRDVRDRVADLESRLAR